ncbi:hypothetical protein ACOSP7_017547 [Xanthoceras sorbifolium]
MKGRNSDTAGPASTSRRAVTNSLININEVKIGAAAPPDSDSVVVQINESKVSSFTENRVVFMSPKQVIMEKCLVENVQQVEKTDSVQNGSNSWQSRFHFEEASLHNEKAKKIIENNGHHLQGFSAVASVLDSVGRVTSRLQTWNRDKRKKATLELKKLRGDLKELMGASGLDFSLIKSIEKKIDLILQDFEVFWSQRSRALWLRGGQKLKFFSY